MLVSGRVDVEGEINISPKETKIGYTTKNVQKKTTLYGSSLYPPVLFGDGEFTWSLQRLSKWPPNRVWKRVTNWNTWWWYTYILHGNSLGCLGYIWDGILPSYVGIIISQFYSKASGHGEFLPFKLPASFGCFDLQKELQKRKALWNHTGVWYNWCDILKHHRFTSGWHHHFTIYFLLFFQKPTPQKMDIHMPYAPWGWNTYPHENPQIWAIHVGW